MIKYKLYGYIHKMAKIILRRSNATKVDLSFIYSKNFSYIKKNSNKIAQINDITFSDEIIKYKNLILFFGENSTINTNFNNNEKFPNIPIQILNKDFVSAWFYALENSLVGPGFKNSGFYITGYIFDYKHACLSSWIWTSAAIARCYVNYGHFDKAISIADKYLEEQLSEGSWIVRYDYDIDEILPIVAPNDSAYISSNCLLEVYNVTKEKKYLDAAEKCANWIINTSNENSLVKFGYNYLTKKWVENKNIVDIGFTATLFSKLYLITKNEGYKNYLSKFIKEYILKFYNSNIGAFSTSIDENNNKLGGYFARGQAWALEGLLSAYEVLQEEQILKVIDENINYIVKNQLKNGGWPYNFSKPLLGEDNKGTPVIAYSLANYCKIIKQKEEIVKSIDDAIKWCVKHTNYTQDFFGGIFSYSAEGAIVHSFYKSVAIIYANAYALEVVKLRGELD